MMRESDREVLRGYLLGTLPDAERELVERRLEDDEAFRLALDAEREALSVLDALPEEAPPVGLAERALERVGHEERVAEAREPGLWTWAPRALSLALLALIVCIPLAMLLSRARYSARIAASAGNLKQLGLIYKMYAGENHGKFPPVAPYENVWAPDLRRLYPTYLVDPTPLVDPKQPGAKRTVARLRAALEADPPRWEEACRIAARNYTYTGWTITDESKLAAMRKRYDLMAKVEDYDRDISADGEHVPRLKDGVERFFITDINNPAAGASTQSTIPIMFEVVGSPDDERPPRGCNVLFMDGHVGFIPYGEAFPVVPSVAEALPAPEVTTPAP